MFCKASALKRINVRYPSQNAGNPLIRFIHYNYTQEAAYTAVAFRMGMQCCFSLLMQLADL